MTSFFTTAFYHFVTLNDVKSMQPIIQDYCDKKLLKGTILLANEGINGTISGKEKDILNFHKFIKNDDKFFNVFRNLEYKASWSDENPFYRMKVRLKKEIVTLGMPEVSPTKKVGTYVKPEDWNSLINDPDITLIDTRNGYEVDIGSFRNAINPKTSSFREFPKYIKKNLNPKKTKKIAMFCTGGIRCEKASSYLLKNGYKNISQLDGGILNYLELRKSDKNTSWQGECFVFDNRVAINKNLDRGSYEQCYGCRHPITKKDMKLKSYIKGATCKYCIDKKTNTKIISSIVRQKQIDLAEIKKISHPFKKIYNEK